MKSTTTERTLLPTIPDVRRTFQEVIATLGGSVPDVHETDTQLYARALLNTAAEVKRGDRITGGVALRVSGPEVRVHPFTMRVVCTNGAVHALAAEGRCLTRTEVSAWSVHSTDTVFEVEAALGTLAETVRDCARPEVLHARVGEMRSAAALEIDVLGALLPLARHMADARGREAVARILARSAARAGTRQNAFDLMNLVTAAARDEPDLELRWQLEAFGGGVPALLIAPVRQAPARVAAAAAR